jgi:hypothetical protein
MRRISIPALGVLLGAGVVWCSPFHGAEGGADTDAGSTVDAATLDGAPVDGSIADASVVDADAGTGCMAFFTQSFDTTPPAPWGAAQQTGNGSTVQVDLSKGANAPGALEAYVDLSMAATPHAFLSASQTAKTPPVHVRLAFSMFLGPNFASSSTGYQAEIGCTLSIGAFQYLLTREGGGSFNAAVNTTAIGVGNITITQAVPEQTWLDVIVDVDGVGGMTTTVKTTIVPHGKDPAMVNPDAFVTTSPLPASTSLSLNCGINFAKPGGNTPTLDVWVDDVTLSQCPP